MYKMCEILSAYGRRVQEELLGKAGDVSRETAMVQGVFWVDAVDWVQLKQDG